MVREKIIDILDGGSFCRHDFSNRYKVDVVNVDREDWGDYADEIMAAFAEIIMGHQAELQTPIGMLRLHIANAREFADELDPEDVSKVVEHYLVRLLAAQHDLLHELGVEMYQRRTHPDVEHGVVVRNPA